MNPYFQETYCAPSFTIDIPDNTYAYSVDFSPMLNLGDTSLSSPTQFLVDPNDYTFQMGGYFPIMDNQYLSSTLNYSDVLQNTPIEPIVYNMQPIETTTKSEVKEKPKKIKAIKKEKKVTKSKGRQPTNKGDEKRVFKCTEEGCNLSFNRSEHLRRHHTSKHTTLRPYQCTFQGCGKMFARSDNLKQHFTIHTRAQEKLSSSHFFLPSNVNVQNLPNHLLNQEVWGLI